MADGRGFLLDISTKDLYFGKFKRNKVHGEAWKIPLNVLEEATKAEDWSYDDTDDNLLTKISRCMHGTWNGMKNLEAISIEMININDKLSSDSLDSVKDYLTNRNKILFNDNN